MAAGINRSIRLEAHSVNFISYFRHIRDIHILCKCQACNSLVVLGEEYKLNSEAVTGRGRTDFLS